MDKCRLCRRFGTKIFLKGERCLSPKCAVTRRNYPPGVQGAKNRKIRRSEYGTQLLEKQKAKAEYGLRERQFANIFNKAVRKKDATGEELLRLLEMRLDNIIYRLGWASSRAQARQLVLHRKINVNDKIVNIPSIVLKPKDIIIPKEKKDIKPIKMTLPKWIKLEAKALKAEIVKIPERKEIETDIDDQLIIEFYSR